MGSKEGILAEERRATFTTPSPLPYAGRAGRPSSAVDGLRCTEIFKKLFATIYKYARHDEGTEVADDNDDPLTVL